ncbi:ATP synthase subunit I [Spongiibacter sp. KMU-158]|uniref:ATP synthase subunit I n=1 Tax=Spongiibacter pelagi TaxID=2760804 RepID=A0A927GUH5_9GAMM|nr:ATP synthase subunit I [Spongiibacter pelagi]MBD2857611.1 ATP synthase subunit I [Spongiibacter pelagi]
MRRPRTALDNIRPPLTKVYLLQSLILLLASAIVVPFDSVSAYSLLIGGMISVVSNAYFARQVFKYAGALRAREVERGFYKGEAGKFVAVMCFFAVTFALVKPINVMVLFAAYLLTTLLNTGLLAGTKRKS